MKKIVIPIVKRGKNFLKKMSYDCEKFKVREIVKSISFISEKKKVSCLNRVHLTSVKLFIILYYLKAIFIFFKIHRPLYDTQ